VPERSNGRAIWLCSAPLPGQVIAADPYRKHTFGGRKSSPTRSCVGFPLVGDDLDVRKIPFMQTNPHPMSSRRVPIGARPREDIAATAGGHCGRPLTQTSVLRPQVLPYGDVAKTHRIQCRPAMGRSHGGCRTHPNVVPQVVTTCIVPTAGQDWRGCTCESISDARRCGSACRNTIAATGAPHRVPMLLCELLPATIS